MFWNWSTPFAISVNKRDDVLNFPISVFEDGFGLKRQKNICDPEERNRADKFPSYY